MYVQVKSSSGLDLVPAETRLMAGRALFIEDAIDTESGCQFVKQMMLLNQESTTKPIQVFINSPGGEVNAGMMMYDVIQTSQAPVRLYCMGRAYSMGALLFASGNHGRYMLPHSKLMIHEPLISKGVGGSSSSISSISASLKNTKRMLDEILAKHTGKTLREIAKATGYDHYFNAQESVDFGLCDGIMDFGAMMKEGEA